MPEYTERGMTLRWPDEAGPAAGGLRRVLVQAGPAASPHDLMRLVYSVDGGPERAVRGWPVGIDPATGLQGFAAHLPAGPDGGAVDWRPVLASGGREMDPGPAGAAARGAAAQAGAAADAATGSASGPAPDPAPDPSPGPARDPMQGRFRPIARFTVPFESDFHPLGETPDGVRLRFGIREGGTVRGPRLNGRILPVGGDWMRVRPDGVGILNARALVEPEDGGGLIMFEDAGICDFGEDGYAALTRGRLPPRAPVRLAPRYLTSNPAYLWLNRVQGFAIGEADLSDVTLRFDVFAAEEDAHG